MLKIYRYNGSTWKFEEGKQPAGAVLVEEKAAQPENKAAKPANKRRKKVDAK